MEAAKVAAANAWATFFRARGWNALPSRTDEKRPMCKFAEYWDAPAPADLFDRFPTSNIQVMTGRRWGLLVIDLDGPEAREEFAGWGPVPRTWATHSGGDGVHLWFTVPKDGPALPKAFLWKGEGKHSAIERLCDRSLIMAPPSVHPTTGRVYRFADRSQSPVTLPMPAPAPAWLLARKPIDPPKAAVTVWMNPPARPQRPSGASGRYRARDVLDAIPDKTAVARTWGVRFTGEVRSSGWAPCRAVGRDDAHPSAAMHTASGVYVDSGTAAKLRFFDLAVACGAYATAQDAIDHLGEVHRADRRMHQRI